MSVNTGDDLSRILAQAGVDLTKEGLKISKETTIEVIKILLMLLKEKEKIKPGKTNLGKLLNSKQKLKMVEMRKDDLKLFTSKAKKYGISYAVIKEGKKYNIVYGERDEELAKRLLEAVKKEKIDSFLKPFKRFKDRIVNGIKKKQLSILNRLNTRIEKKIKKLEVTNTKSKDPILQESKSEKPQTNEKSEVKEKDNLEVNRKDMRNKKDLVEHLEKLNEKNVSTSKTASKVVTKTLPKKSKAR